MAVGQFESMVLMDSIGIYFCVEGFCNKSEEELWMPSGPIKFENQIMAF